MKPVTVASVVTLHVTLPVARPVSYATMYVRVAMIVTVVILYATVVTTVMQVVIQDATALMVDVLYVRLIVLPATGPAMVDAIPVFQG